MFERFTERARQVVVLAQDSARAHNHNYIGTEHVLLGLLREEEGLAAKVLGELGLRAVEVDAEVSAIVGEGEVLVGAEGLGHNIPFTPKARKALELGLREALSLGHNYIGTEHILLGLVRVADNQNDDGCIAGRILTNHGLVLEQVRDAVVAKLSGQTRRATHAPEMVSEVIAALRAAAQAPRDEGDELEVAEDDEGDACDEGPYYSGKRGQLTVEERLSRIEAYLGIPR